MRKSIKLLFLASVFVLAATFSIITTIKNFENRTVAGWGDNSGGRESHTQWEVSSGVLGDAIVFNSIRDGEIGNEKNFVGARLDDGTNADADHIWNGNEISVEDGAVYFVRAYVHNNSPLGYDAVAENVKVAFSIPTVSAKTIPINGFIFCDNAAPSKYWDSVVFTSDNFFHLEYVYGSASLKNNGIGKNGGRALNDEIVTKAASNNGTLIGYSSLNGEIPGGLQYDAYITIKVRVVFDSDYIVEAKTRLAGVTGPDTWTTQVEADIGDEVEIQIQYRNTSEETQEGVVIKSNLPSNLEYIPDSTLIYNANYDGASIDQDSIVTTGINIGNYTAGSNAYIRFTARVVDADLANGSNTLVGWTQCGIGQTTLQDYVTIIVKKN